MKFQDKEEWIRPNNRSHFLAEIQKFQNVPVEAVDASGCAINYQGLSNLLPLKELRSLSLQRCPNLDDWCLSRLYLLAGSLQELSLAGCPRISERGLACLHHLQNLRRLDISDLPAVSHPGLTQILVEEMLPHCEVLGADWAQNLKLEPDKQPPDTSTPLFLACGPALEGSCGLCGESEVFSQSGFWCSSFSTEQHGKIRRLSQDWLTAACNWQTSVAWADSPPCCDSCMRLHRFPKLCPYTSAGTVADMRHCWPTRTRDQQPPEPHGITH